MKTFAICNDYFKNNKIGEYFDYFDFHGNHILCGLVEDTRFPDCLLPLDPEEVLIKTIAFSCNFRDRGLLLRNLVNCKNTLPPYIYAPFGSDFVAEVLDCGSNVKNVKSGDRVIPDCSYPYKTISLPGIPTNFASQRFHKLNYDQIIKIPDNMTVEKAAGFSIGAQTGYSMIRKVNIQKNENILLTAGTSNTSLFILSKLGREFSNIYVISSREQFYPKLCELGAKKCVDIGNIQGLSSEIGGFDVVIDPFFDLHINILTGMMNQFGRYIFCGLYMQHQDFNYGKEEQPSIHPNYTPALLNLMYNNISLIGNCIGTQEDIKTALIDYEEENYDVLIDSVYTKQELVPFLTRSYLDIDRFGKVIYKYDD